MRVSLKDGFSKVTAMMFDASEESLASLGIRQNTIADAELSVSEYQGSKSFKIVQIRPAADSTLLVIEPAKGEYKDVFSKYGDILYGTNPRKTPLLRINPFSFPNDVHPSKKHIVQKGHLDNKYLSTSSCIYKNLSTYGFMYVSTRHIVLPAKSKIWGTTYFRQILPVTTPQILEGRQPVGGFLPCHRQNYA